MNEILDLTEEQIRDLTGAAAFKRGLALFERDEIVEAMATQSSLGGLFPGQGDALHEPWINVDDGEIVEASCTCRAGQHGRCQHVAALLLTWIHHPEAFGHEEPLAEALATLGRDELVDLVLTLLSSSPEQESLVRLTIQARPGYDGPPNPQLIRQYAEALFVRAIESDSPTEEVLLGLEDLLEVGSRYEDQGRYGHAAMVYGAVVGEGSSFYREMPDEEEELPDVILEAAEGLARCTAQLEPGAERTLLLHMMYDTFCWDVAEGGHLGPADAIEEALMEMVTPEEGRQIGEWVAKTLASGEPWIDDYARLALGGLWLSMVREGMDEEEFLAVCRQTGQSQALVEHLLARGQVDEAAAEMTTAPLLTVPRLADMLVDAGRGMLAEEIVRRRLEEDDDSLELLTWLKRRVEARGDLHEAVELAEAIFDAYRVPVTYEDLVRLAEEAGVWESMRPRLLDKLGEEGEHGLVARILLWHGEAEAAVKAMLSAGGDLTGPLGRLALELAIAVEASYPEGALAIYLELVEASIAKRRREHYEQAALTLLRVRRLQKPDAWQALISDLRTRYSRLYALQDELDQAGL